MKFSIYPKSNNVIGFDDTILFIVGCLLNTTIVMPIFYGDILVSGYYKEFFKLFVFVLLYIIIVWYSLRMYYLFISKNYPGISNFKKRLSTLPLVAIIYFSIIPIFRAIFTPVFSIDNPEHIKLPTIIEYMIGFVVVLVDLGIYEGLTLFAEIKDSKIKEEILKKESAISRLNSIKHQVSPHFLFNNFNTLAYLIEHNKEESISFVHKMSYLYSYILDTNEKFLVTLKYELKHINAYLFLIQKRYEDNICYNQNIPDGVFNLMIVPFGIFFGIENAIKHNIISSDKPLTIDVYVEDKHVIVKNNIQRKKPEFSNYGVGLKNIQSRYNLVANKDIIIINKGHSFILKLPILEDFSE